MTKVRIPETLLEQIFEQAESEYPNECCGMILGPQTDPAQLSRLRPCGNVQDQYHAKDPVNFPRTARTAYFIEPKELLAIQKEVRDRHEDIRVIYHSHIDTGAYFSEEDKRIAAPEGEPAYPEVQYLIVSVREGKVHDHRLFYWDEWKKDFLS